MACAYAPIDEDDDEISIDEIKVEIRQLYGDDYHRDDDIDFEQPPNTDEAAFAEFDASVDILKDEAEKMIGCASCSRPERVFDVNLLERGQHISTVQKTDDSGHAIIEEVKHVECSSLATVVVLHLTKKDDTIGVYRETKEFNLKEMKMTIIRYTHSRYNPEEIIQRAESLLDSSHLPEFITPQRDSKYFAIWCVIGEEEHFLFQHHRKMIMKILLDTLPKRAKKMKEFLSKASSKLLLGHEAAVYLVYCIALTISYILKSKAGQMCGSCAKEKIKDLWFTFGIYGSTLLVSLIKLFAIPLMAFWLGFPLSIVLPIVSLALQALPTLRKALKSPFLGDRIRVSKLNELDEGDVVMFLYFGFEHTCIVTKVDEEQNRLKVVHYASKYKFRTREIVEEDVELDLKKTNVYLIDCKCQNTFPKDVVVSRAQSRIGEKKWNLFSNRSDNFSHWAKVKPTYSDIFNDPILPIRSSVVDFFIEEREIYRIDDLRKGDVVKSSVIGIIDNTGIVSDIRQLDDVNPRMFEIDVISYSFAMVIKKTTYKIDLNKKRLFVKSYNPVLCHEMDERRRNAEELYESGEKGKWWTTKGFIEHCIRNKCNGKMMEQTCSK